MGSVSELRGQIVKCLSPGTTLDGSSDLSPASEPEPAPQVVLIQEHKSSVRGMETKNIWKVVFSGNGDGF